MPAPNTKSQPPTADTTARYVRVFNTEEFAIPPFAAMEVCGYDKAEGLFRVRQPTVTGRNDCLFNGATTIPAGFSGQALMGAGEVAALMAPDHTEPQAGQIWGPVAGSWALSPQSTGYVVRTVGSANRSTVVVTRAPSSYKEWVRILTDEESSGVGSGSGAWEDKPDTYYRGVIQRFNIAADEWEDTEVYVWWRDKAGNEPGAGVRYESRHHGNAGGAAEYYPLFMGDTGAENDPNNTPSSCATDSFLTSLGAGTCWTWYRKGGSGRCSCFPTDDHNDPQAGVKMILDAGLGGWVGAKANTDGASAMIETCCGCGAGILKLTGGAPGQRATFEFHRVHVNCPDPDAEGGSGSGSGSGSSEVFTEVLDSYCVGTLPNGKRYLLFSGQSVNLCGNRLVGCDNELKIMVVCGDDCPTPICDCEGCYQCYDAQSPNAYFMDMSGFANPAHNGAWVLSWQDGCDWAAECLTGTATLGYVPGTPDKWRLTHADGSVYELDADDWTCFGTNLMNRVSGSGPLTVEVRGLGSFEEDSELDCFDMPDIIAEVTIDGCGTFELTFSWDDDEESYVANQAMGLCVCPDTPDEIWSWTLACVSNVWTILGGAPSGDSTFSGFTPDSLVPFTGSTTGTVTCGSGGTRSASVVFTQVP